MISQLIKKNVSKKPFNYYLFEEKERFQIRDLNKQIKEGEIIGINDKGLILEFYGENSFFLENHEFKSSIISKKPCFKVKNFYNLQLIKTFEPWVIDKIQKKALNKQKLKKDNKKSKLKKVYNLNKSIKTNYIVRNNNLITTSTNSKKIENYHSNLNSNFLIKKFWYLKNKNKKIKFFDKKFKIKIKFKNNNITGSKTKITINYKKKTLL